MKHWYWACELSNGEFTANTFAHGSSLYEVWNKIERIFTKRVARGRIDPTSLTVDKTGIKFVETRHHNHIEWRICMD